MVDDPDDFKSLKPIVITVTDEEYDAIVALLFDDEEDE